MGGEAIGACPSRTRELARDGATDLISSTAVSTRRGRPDSVRSLLKVIGRSVFEHIVKQGMPMQWFSPAHRRPSMPTAPHPGPSQSNPAAAAWQYVRHQSRRASRSTLALARRWTGQISGVARPRAKSRTLDRHRSSAFKGSEGHRHSLTAHSQAGDRSPPAPALRWLLRTSGGEQRIDHQIANELNTVRRDSLTNQVCKGAVLGRIQQVGDLVGVAIDSSGMVRSKLRSPAST
jgi:hypothetical protein